MSGFDGTAMGSVAQTAGIVPSAAYHYFPDKESLYEAVFAATASHLWSLLDASVRGQPSAREAIEALILAADVTAEQLPFYGRFLEAVTTEAARHPRFVGLLDRRNELQRSTFEFLSDLGLSTGEFPLPPAGVSLPDELRALVVGWLAERQRQSPLARPTPRGLLSLLRLHARPDLADAHIR